MDHPLFKKLLVKPGFKVLTVNAPDDIAGILGDIPAGIDVVSKRGGIFDAILLFNKDSKELKKGLAAIEKNRAADTVIWDIYPKKSSMIPTDLNAMTPWQALDEFNLEVVASAGINDVWTAVRLRPKGQSKASGMCLDDIANNEYGRFIDVKNRVVVMPDDMKVAVARNKSAWSCFDQLSFSNKKEYVLWVLSAKQEKTRMNRIEQSVAKLEAGKKNPSVK